MLKTNNKVIKKVSSLPSTGDTNSIYYNTTDGFYYGWNSVTNQFDNLSQGGDPISVYIQSSSTTKPSPAVEGDELIVTDNGLATGNVLEQWIFDGSTWIQMPNDKVLDVLTTAQTPPTIGSINTTNLGKIFKGTDGNSYIVDYSGEAIQLGSPIFKEARQWHVDKNGNDTTGTGADENPFLTIGKALTSAPQGHAIIVNEGTYAEAVTLATPNQTLRGQGQEYGGLTEINSLDATANGTSVRASSLTVTGTVTHSGTAPLYLSEMTVVGDYESSSTAYTEIKDSRLQDGTISKTAAGILFIQDSLIGNATFSTANSVISLRNVTIDVGDKVTIGSGVIYSVLDTVGDIEIDANAIPLETALLAQGLTAEQAKAAQTSNFNMIRLLDPDTNANPTKFVTYNETTKRLEISNAPTQRKEILDEFNATAGQTSFTLTQTPIGAVKMTRNGVLLPKAAWTVSGTTVTYVPASNNNNAMILNDRVEFFYETLQ